MLQRLDFVERRHAVPRLVRWLSMTVLTLLCGVALAAPTDVILVLDNSGSMRKNDPEFLLKRAVTAFVNELGEETQVGMVIFDQKVVYPVTLGPLDVASRNQLQQSLESIDYRGKFTDIPAAIERAIYELKTNARADAARVIVFMTDGIVDTGNAAIDAEKAKWLRDELVADAAENAVKIFAIAFTDEADFFLIQSLANKTGGEYFRAPRAADLAGVFENVQKRLAAPPAVVPAPVPPPAVSAPPPAPAVAGTCLDTLSAEERLAMEETAPSAGITAEEMCQQMEQAAPGTVIVHAPPSATEAPVTQDGESGGVLNLVIIAVLALLLILMVVVVVLVLRRRGGQPAASAAPASSPVRVPEAYLKDIHGINQQGPVRLSARPVLIGRVAGSDPEHLDYFVVDKGTVGRRHALIQFRDFSFWLSDQGSVNGTFLNGERLTGDRQLKHGDRVKFHKYEFEFSMPELDQASHTVFATSHEMTMAGDATLVGAPVAAIAAAASAARPAAADQQADADVFDITGEGDDVDGDASAGQVDLFVDGDDTALSARSAAARADFPAAEGADEWHAEAIDPRDDSGDLAGFANSSAAGSGDAFDTEASAFFDDDLGSPTAYEDAAAEYGRAAPAHPVRGDQDAGDEFATVLPEVPAADSGLYSESETLLPEAPYPDDASSATASNISLDRFMETESFFNRGAGQDREDATVMPEQGPDDGLPAPAMDDFFDITGIDVDSEAAPDDDDDSESPTKFRR